MTDLSNFNPSGIISICSWFQILEIDQSPEEDVSLTVVKKSFSFNYAASAPTFHFQMYKNPSLFLKGCPIYLSHASSCPNLTGRGRWLPTLSIIQGFFPLKRSFSSPLLPNACSWENVGSLWIILWREWCSFSMWRVQREDSIMILYNINITELGCHWSVKHLLISSKHKVQLRHQDSRFEIPIIYHFARKDCSV